mmetsp:Transcript_30888/g.75334  ORF Transcript_30888/g.75334 Transcript_30888/m.75334 type:complete len:504 (+) Transcript_30888:562-2073(+)
MGVAGRQGGHNGCISHSEAYGPPDTQLAVDDGTRILREIPHLAGSCKVADDWGVRVVAHGRVRVARRALDVPLHLLRRLNLFPREALFPDEGLEAQGVEQRPDLGYGPNEGFHVTVDAQVAAVEHGGDKGVVALEVDRSSALREVVRDLHRQDPPRRLVIRLWIRFWLPSCRRGGGGGGGGGGFGGSIGGGGGRGVVLRGRGCGGLALVQRAGAARPLRPTVAVEVPRLLVDLIVRMQRELDVGARVPRRLHEAAGEEPWSAEEPFLIVHIDLPLPVARRIEARWRPFYAAAMEPMSFLNLRSELLAPLEIERRGLELDDRIGSVHEVLPDAFDIAQHLDLMGLELMLRPHAAEHQELRRVDRPGREDHLLRRESGAPALRLVVRVEPHEVHALRPWRRSARTTLYQHPGGVAVAEDVEARLAIPWECGRRKGGEEAAARVLPLLRVLVGLLLLSLGPEALSMQVDVGSHHVCRVFRAEEGRGTRVPDAVANSKLEVPSARPP